MSRDIPLSKIEPDPKQPRKHFDAGKLGELAQSMRENGLAVAILVRPVAGGYLIVHGERRYRAAQALGWNTIRAEVREMTADEAAMLALVENVQRADLSPIEEAQAYRAYVDAGMTQTALGEQIGKSQSYIASKLRLLKMPRALQLLLDRGALTEGHVKQLLRLKSFYDGATNEAWQEPVDWQELAEAPATYVQGYLVACRPLDGWFGTLVMLDEAERTPEQDAMIALAFDAIRALHDEVSGAGAWAWWQSTALWFALLACFEGMAVADLKEGIDTFMAYVVHAAAYLQHRGAPAENDRYGHAWYWGARADLRHAGLSAWGNEGNGRIYSGERPLVADRRLFDWDKWLLPTAMQREIERDPDGPIARRHRWLNARV